MNEKHIPLGDTRYVFRILKYIMHPLFLKEVSYKFPKVVFDGIHERNKTTYSCYSLSPPQYVCLFTPLANSCLVHKYFWLI